MAIAIGLLKMLLELQESRKTGALDVAGPAARVRLFVENGRLVYADEGTVGETLGRLLVRERVLDQDQYAAAIEWMADLRSRGKRAMLGEVFVNLGLLTEQQVHAALSAQVQQKAMRALGWPSAGFRFIESPGPLELPNRFATPIEPLVVAALRLADRDRVDALLLQARDRHAALRGDHVPGGGAAKQESMARLTAFGLQPAEEAFALGLDATRTVRELLEASDADGVDRPVILAALLLTDVLDLHAAASVRGGSAPRSVPRPAPNSGRLAVAAAAPAAPSWPPVPPAPAPGAPREPAPNRDAPISSATGVGPETPVAPMAPLLAEKAYQAGKRFARANRMADAVKELRRAASLYPAAEYDLWAAWAEARADDTSSDSHSDALRRAAEVAIEEDTERGFATFVLGYLARRAGENGTADTLFERARALDPDAIEDAWEARLLPPAATSATKSDVRSLAPLLGAAVAPNATGAVPKVDPGESGLGGGVATLRGIAAADALQDARGRLEQEEARGRVRANAKVKAKEYADARVKAKADADALVEKADASAKASGETPAPGVVGAVVGAAMVAVVVAGAVVEAKKAEAEATAEEKADAVADSRSAHGERGRGWAWAVGAIAVVGAGVFFATRTGAPVASDERGAALPSGSAPFTPVASAPEPVASVTAPASAAPTPAADASIDAAPSYAGVDAGLPAVDATKGVLVLPESADSHRVYVDGRLAGVPPPPIVVGCGRHVVKIGSQGREQTVLVPCGGSVSITYP